MCNCTCVDLNEEPMDKCYPEYTSPEIIVGKGWRQLIDEMSEEEKAAYTWKTEVINAPDRQDEVFRKL